MPGEFDLIARHFAALTQPRADVVLGVGDDAALLDLPPGQELVATVDTLALGVHFFADCPPAALGHKALAVNLSDLAAMGAAPAWALLALTLPAADDAWLAEFASGFAALARQFEVSLVGGDTCRGPLAVTITALGHVPRGQALRRSGARPGDGVYLSGQIGAAGWRCGHGAARSGCRQRSPPMPRSDSTVRSRAWRSAWPCAVWPARPSMCRTACWRIWATSA
jgi:thiamine-monophosphate kinase